MKKVFLILSYLLLIQSTPPLYAENSISVGDLLKKIGQTSKANADNSDLNNNQNSPFSIKSIEDAKKFLASSDSPYRRTVVEVKESPAFEGFYSTYAQNSENVWLPKGVYFSKSENLVLITRGLFQNEVPMGLYKIENQKLVQTNSEIKTYVKSHLLTNIKTSQLLKLTSSSINPKTFVISASDCPFCQKLEKELVKKDISHYIIPIGSKFDEFHSEQARKSNVSLNCKGEKSWIEKMVKNSSTGNVDLCDEKSDYNYTAEEILEVLNSTNLMKGYPTTIFTADKESAVITGYCSALPKLINNNNLGKNVNLDECH